MSYAITIVTLPPPTTTTTGVSNGTLVQTRQSFAVSGEEYEDSDNNDTDHSSDDDENEEDGELYIPNSFEGMHQTLAVMSYGLFWRWHSLHSIY